MHQTDVHTCMLLYEGWKKSLLAQSVSQCWVLWFVVFLFAHHTEAFPPAASLCVGCLLSQVNSSVSFTFLLQEDVRLSPQTHTCLLACL